MSKKMMRARKNARCKLCGCTDDRACMTPNGPCHWVKKDLCSACARPRETLISLRQKEVRHDVAR